MKRTGFQLSDFTIEQFLSLLDIYLSEWAHRSEVMWRQVFYYFYATIIVLFLPNFAAFIGIALPDFPELLFPLLGFVLSFAFLYISLGLALRIDASVRTYNKLVKYLPAELQKITVESSEIKYGKFFKRRMSTSICWILFFCLISMSVVMIAYNLFQKSGV